MIYTESRSGTNPEVNVERGAFGIGSLCAWMVVMSNSISLSSDSGRTPQRHAKSIQKASHVGDVESRYAAYESSSRTYQSNLTAASRLVRGQLFQDANQNTIRLGGMGY